MDRLVNAILILLPFVALGFAMRFAYVAYNDLLHRQVPNRMWWTMIILCCPIIGPLYYLNNFRDR